MLTLKEMCLSLPYRDRLNLCAALQDSITQERKDGENACLNRGQILLGYVGDIIGEPIPAKSRKPRYVWARTMVAYQLTREGYSSIDAGWMVGKDHASVMYMKSKMEDVFAYPHIYKDIINIWKQFQDRIDHDIHKGTTQDLICLGD
jgi:hypothetical protein